MDTAMRPARQHGTSDGIKATRTLRWIGAEVPPGRFFEGEHVLARIAPFLATVAVPFAILPALGVSLGSWQVMLSLAIGLGMVGSALLLRWERLPPWTQAIPVLAGFAVIALLRDIGGEDAVIFEPMVIAPIAWLALYGTRAQLWLGIACMATILALPPLLFGPPTYESDQLIRAGIAVVIAGASGFAVQTLVAATRQLASEARAILETSQDAFVSVDGQGLIGEWNPAAERMFGWKREQVLGRSILDTAVPPDEREAAVKRMALIAAGVERPPSRIQARAMRRDGSFFPIEMTVSPTRSARGWTYNAFLHDVSARIASQDALREAEERFRRAFEDNRVGMALVSVDGVFARVNASFCELLGYEPEELVGRGFPEITHPDDIAATMESVREVVEGDRVGFRTEKRCRQANGHYIWTAVNVSSIRDERGMALSLIVQVEDITASKAQEAKLTRQALHDALTGLPNRLLFADRVRVASARREGGCYGVVFIDLDGFKPINDTFGHSAGDDVLVEVARRLQTRLREGDTLARLGGDEFAILCEDTDEAAARMVAERVIEAFAESFDVAGRSIQQAASIGVAVLSRDGRAADPDEVLGRADAAMYRAKAAGKARYTMFEGWMAQGHPDRGGLEQELRRAVADKELTLHYQPEVDLETGEVTGAEALVRWRHPRRGLLEPAQFMFVAEASDLIVAIDDFVLRQACVQASRWHRDLPERGLVVSVNLSERRLAEPGLSNRIAQAIGDAGLPPESLCVEVAERALLDRRGRTLAALPDLEALGVRLLVDDFGVAASSFNALQSLPRLSGIKIDSSFIAGLGRSREDAVGVAAIIGLAHGLGVHATAEGVETPEQLAELRELGCDRAQGYHFARPQPAGPFEELLASARHGELLV